MFSPFTLIDGYPLDFATQCQLRAGLYCEVHDEPDPTNTEEERTTSGIALGPAHPYTGSWEFMSLQTGRKVTRRAWTQLPITDDVIDRVHELANVPEDAEPDAFLHEWQPRFPIIDLPIAQVEQGALVPPAGAGENDAQDDDDALTDTDTDDSNDSSSEDARQSAIYMFFIYSFIFEGSY